MATIAREKNGQIQITLTIPVSRLKITRKSVVEKLTREVLVPGFRKGKAPLEKALNQIPEEKITQDVLVQLLPHYFAQAIKEHKIKPVIYPRFELISAQEGKDWQVRAITCEMPEIKLGNYQKAVKDTLKRETAKTKEEKQTQALGALLETAQIDLPEFLITEEVNHKLAHLVERLDKLGLSLEKYLASIGKSIDILKQEYQKQAQESLKIEFILNKIITEEKIKVSDKEVAETIKAASVPDTPQQRESIALVLRKRAVLDSLMTLV